MVASIINKNEKMKKVIVFGATGNLGAYITIYLKSVGYDVIAVGHRKDDNGFKRNEILFSRYNKARRV